LSKMLCGTPGVPDLASVKISPRHLTLLNCRKSNATKTAERALAGGRAARAATLAARLLPLNSQVADERQ
jgi:hypothetical protein